MTADFSSVAQAVAVGVSLIACATDLRWRRIPNLLTGAAALAALGYHGITGGAAAMLWSVAGCVLGLALFFPFFMLRGMGGGDVKLLACTGAWVGPRLVTWTALFGGVAGGVLALAVVLWHGVLRQTVGNLGILLTHWRVAGVGPVEGITLDSSRSPKLAYAIPLTCGLLVAVWLKA